MHEADCDNPVGNLGLLESAAAADLLLGAPFAAFGEPPGQERANAPAPPETVLVSVVVPAYNEERYLGVCLDALLRQEHADFDYEIIVVDDGSIDRTGDLARARGARLLRREKGGVSKARQSGFEAARGRIVASTDADTVCPPFWLRYIVNHFRHEPRLVGIFGPVRLGDAGPHADAIVHGAGILVNRLHCAIGKPGFSGSNFAVRKEAWQRAGGFNVDWQSAEDVSLSLRLKHFGMIRFDSRLVVATSARRLRLGWWSVARQYGANYLRVFWLQKSGASFENVR